MTEQERLNEIERVITKGPYTDNWESLSQYHVPEWYMNLKFGIFIHWGVYSVPAFANEWYPRSMYCPGTREFEHHIQTYGPQKDFGYKDFIPLFKAEKFDPAAWADLFRQTGARYVIPVAEHHDGFQMYKSELSHWNAYEMGPHRDVLGELSAACRANGLQTGASTHRIEHFWFQGKGRTFDSDIKDPQKGDLYWPSVTEPDNFNMNALDDLKPTKEYLEDWMLRTCELIDRYQPAMLYFDWWIQQVSARPYLAKIAAYYYNRAAERGTQAVINYKHDAFPFGCAVPDVERGQFAELKPFFWQTDTAIAYNSWCWTEGNAFKPAEDLVRDLVDVVSKNGTFLLNVGPKPDGTISDEDTAVLTAIGDWMRVNGEAIYDTRPWKYFGEGPTQVKEGHFSDSERKGFTHEDVRYTRKGDSLYATFLAPSPDGTYRAPTLARNEDGHARFHGLVLDVQRLDGKPCTWERGENSLIIRTEKGEGVMPVSFRVTVS
ncbi:MAG: alpha-L-fucosidase [Clostridia bacterium]|nr:alpha-L-fucosidase [Clostridia bacterium]